MDSKVIGLLGVISLVATLDASQAATPADSSQGALPKAGSYSELLDPIPNALALLRAADAVAPSAPQADVKVAQYYHHHHHHHRYRARRHSHHHHHHHHRYY